MGTFNHTPNDIIIINNSNYPLAFFLTVEPSYALPSGMTTQYYEQTVAWNISDNKTGYNNTIPWGVGDGYISNQAAYDAAYTSYLNSFITLEEAKITRINQMLAYANGILTGNVIVNYYQYFSDEAFLSKLINEDLSFTRLGLPVAYYVNDYQYDHVTIGTLGALESIIDRTNKLYYLTDLNIDTHRTNINALGTVSAVQAYDFTGNWVLTPFATTFYASYAASINGTYGDGTLTGSAAGGAAIAAGWLNLAYNDVRYVSYSATANAASQQKGMILYDIKPAYSGTPAGNLTHFTISKANADADNEISLYHGSDGNLHLTINDNTGTPIISAVSIGAWSPVSATVYAFKLIYDITTGATKLYINNVQLGSTIVSTGTRDSSIGLLRVGGSYDSGSPTNSNFSIRKFTVRDSEIL